MNELAELKRKLKMYEEWEAIINGISPEVCSVIDLDKFLQATVDKVGAMMGADRCDLAIAGEKGFTVRYHYRAEEDIVSSLNMVLSGIEDLVKEKGGRKPVAIADISSSLLPLPFREQLSSTLNTRSLILAPIVFRADLLGLIGLHFCRERRELPPEEIDILRSLASQIAIGFKYTELYTEKEREVKVTRVLLEIASEINSKLDLAEITSFLIDKCLELVKADYGAIGITGDGGKKLSLNTVRGAGGEEKSMLHPVIPVEELPLLGGYLASGRAVPIEETGGGELASYLLRKAFSGETGLIAPIVSGGTPLGALILIWRRKKLLTSYELSLIEGIASQASVILEREKLSTELTALRRELKGVRAGEIIVGRSPKIRKCLEMALNVAESEATVLIEGESGTGKELLADLIQKNSTRRDAPYIKINCGAIPETLLESELFGHEKGAFTDAKSRRRGVFELAHRGILLLDEIGEMSPSAQVKLLRVLETGEFSRLGGNEKIKVDVRVIALTNVDLEQAVSEGRFRKDLFFRLNVYPITLPTLRERKEDIPLLVDHFLKVYQKKANKYIAGASEEAMRLLRVYSFPGNVRELENAIERAVIMTGKRVITADELPERIRSSGAGERTVELPLGIPLEEAERRLILETLATTGNDKTRTAEILGIGRKTLYRKLNRYGITNNNEK
jgi:transcriptional regulator with GAF, ATPase, and Fis domain